jgi:hypothetical protein
MQAYQANPAPKPRLTPARCTRVTPLTQTILWSVEGVPVAELVRGVQGYLIFRFDRSEPFPTAASTACLSTSFPFPVRKELP